MSLSSSILKAAACGFFVTPAPTLGAGMGTRERSVERKTRKAQWGEEEDHTLLSMRKLGLGWLAIGQALGKSHESCRQRHILITNKKGKAK